MSQPQTMTIQQARDSFADLVNMAKWEQQAVEITRYGKTVAYLVGPEWYERAAAALARSATDEAN